MTNRVESLIATFQQFYFDGHESNGRKEPHDVEIKEEDILRILKDGTFLSTNVKESQLFCNKSKSDLISCVISLFAIFNKTENAYDRVVIALLLSRIFGYYLPNTHSLISVGTIDYSIIQAIENQNYKQALEQLHDVIINPFNVCESILKGIGIAFHGRAFQILEQEVQNSIRKNKPDLFRTYSNITYHLRIPNRFQYNVEITKMPVRIELTSCVGSDIFFLAMTRPEKARCINISVDLFDEFLGKHDCPIHVATRPISEKGIRLTSIDLGCSKLVTSVDDLFNMRNDDLCLLKAAIIASGIVPPSIADAKNISLGSLLELLTEDMPGIQGFELITRVVKIPRGSGLAVSTNLLAGMILSLMRFSGQFHGREVTEDQKLNVAARAIYAEWLGGSGGGWQDYGGLWGGIKEITGVRENKEDGGVGNLLPKYEKLEIPNEIVDKVLASIALVNGGTGQDVGPILKTIAFQFATKNDIAWKARQNTEDKYDKIKKALICGNVRELAFLESLDFINRIKISPLANNLYHEMHMERLREILGDHIWGYDSTGGRAGAGGVFWINPEKRPFFETLFVTLGEEIQNELKGQMHFASAPLVYNFKLNTDGVTVDEVNIEGFSKLIDSWTDQQHEKELNDNEEEVEEVKARYGYNNNFFRKLQKEYQGGKLSLENNASTTVQKIITSLEGKNFQSMPFPDSKEYGELYKQGIQHLKEPIAYVTLNGGESTRYGTHVIRSLNPSIYIDGKYCSPIELKMANAKFIREIFGAQIIPVFVNGYFTDFNTKRVLRNNDYYGIPSEDVHFCTHEVIHRVIPSQQDLNYWFHSIREKPISAREEVLAEQYHHAMQLWIDEKGAGEIYIPIGKSKLSTLVSPGHYFSFMSLIVDGVIGELIKKGVQHLLISSNDNLMSTLDPAILAFHVSNKNNVTSEIVPRLFDRGGAPVMIDGKIQIFEDFRFPNQETLWKAPFFNPITSWIKIDAILQLLKLEKSDVIQASEKNKCSIEKCREAVQELAEKLSTYPVLKHISEDVGKGISYTFPVIQFEKLFGDLISMLEPCFLVVPKLMRHTQIKSVDHIYHVYNDRSLDVLKPQIALRRELQQKFKKDEIWA